MPAGKASSVTGLSTAEGLPQVKEEGAPSRVVTERGTQLETRFAVRDASSLITSHDDALRPNPAFPAELELRDRSRAALEAQTRWQHAPW